MERSSAATLPHVSSSIPDSGVIERVQTASGIEICVESSLQADLCVSFTFETFQFASRYGRPSEHWQLPGLKNCPRASHRNFANGSHAAGKLKLRQIRLA
jgi:hypothetical protein